MAVNKYKPHVYIIPEDDANSLREAGVRAVYTPKDFDLTRIMADIVELLGVELLGVETLGVEPVAEPTPEH